MARQEAAQVGALFIYELVVNSRGMVEKPLQIQFVTGGPMVELFKLDDPEPRTLPANRTGIPEGPKRPAG